MKRKTWWFLGILLLMPLAIGLVRLRFDGEVLDLLPANVPVVHGLKTYQDHFSSRRELIITVESDNRELSLTSARQIAEELRRQTKDISQVTWCPPWTEHPEQTGELIAYLWLNQPPTEFRGLAERLADTNLSAVLSAAREELATTLSPGEIARISYDPYGMTRLPDSVLSSAPGFAEGEAMFSSPEGTFRIILVKSRQDLADYRDCTAWLKRVQKAALSATPKAVALGFTGRPAFVAEMATSMKRDLVFSVLGTAVIIATLFWLAHRRWKPMLWLLCLLALILVATVAVGGLVFKTIHVLSVGFAAVLLGLAVDYAVVHYQEALAHPSMTVPQIRRAIAPSIFWAAVTTVSAFAVLNFGGLPGLAQLGSLVAVGVMLSAGVMIFAFLPPLFPDRMGSGIERPSGVSVAAAPFQTTGPCRGNFAVPLSVVLVFICIAVLSSGFPKVMASAAALQPRDSRAFLALEAIKSHLNRSREPLCVTIGGQDESEVARKLLLTESSLQRAVSNGTLETFILPTSLWPQPQNQASNKETALRLASRRQSLRTEALAAGFSTEALGLTDMLLDTWEREAASTATSWPTNPLCSWLLEKFAAREPTNFLAAGFLFPTGASTNLAALEKLNLSLAAEEICISGWEMLGQSLLGVVQRNFWKLIVPIILLVIASLGLAFRRLAEVLLSIGVLVVSGLCLLTIMRLMSWSWNLLNLMAWPLILGTGVDYSIFMLLALRRYGGDPVLAHQSVGRALLLCGGTAVSGFGCLGLSANAGMASLGQVCAVGIAANMMLAVFALPAWWLRFAQPNRKAELKHNSPSSLYSAVFWHACLLLAGKLPLQMSQKLAVKVARLYFALVPRRREIVVENMLPVLRGDRVCAEQTACKLIANFACKLLDLWRCEAGIPIHGKNTKWTGWELFEAVYARKKGVLIVTAHLGNWEIGADLFIQQGIPLLVLTQPEPDARLTELRRAARAQRGIETLVVGNDAFALVEVIKRLQAGGVVALLVDRPPFAKAVDIEFFGTPFRASIAAAELARASGCGILTSAVLFNGTGYDAAVLGEIAYKQEDISNRAERIRLTREILRALEPVIRQNLDQWYHFVPIWTPTVPADRCGAGSGSPS
jgi:predicted exporter/lauroyl/myristoyl acyltransferase